MITMIRVDGFKSLNNFKLEIRPGLNILVGPNGSGKTNIILFFEFLSYLTSEDLYTAVSKAGGAGSIFRKRGQASYDKVIRCTIDGCKKITDKYIQYQFYFEIEISFDKDFLFFKEQVYKAKERSEFTTIEVVDSWDLILRQQIDECSKSVITLESVDVNVFKPRFASQTKSSDEVKAIAKEYLKDFQGTTMSLLQLTYSFGDRNYYVIEDLRSGETFNIIPSKVKQPEDSANPPGIKKDGTGLANTLFAMKSERTNDFIYRYLLSDLPKSIYTPNTLSRIIENVKLANSSIQKIDVSNDPFNNQLTVRINIKGQDVSQNIVLPLSAMSDGTIKWITLITAIITSNEIFSIEEPENFLHPHMQSEIVKFMRNTFDEKTGESFILMTTHSETLLNDAKPEELIVTSLENGITKAKRLVDTLLIDQEIRNTGFGLGYYYISDAL